MRSGYRIFGPIGSPFPHTHPLSSLQPAPTRNHLPSYRSAGKSQSCTNPHHHSKAEHERQVNRGLDGRGGRSLDSIRRFPNSKPALAGSLATDCKGISASEAAGRILSKSLLVALRQRRRVLLRTASDLLAFPAPPLEQYDAGDGDCSFGNYDGHIHAVRMQANWNC